MRRLTSRQNPLVSRCRAAARGALDGALLVDGAHLVSDALDAGVRIREAIVAADAGDRAELRALVDRLCRAGVDVVSATSAVMDAASPVRSPSAIVALADRPARSADAVYQGAPPFVIIAIGVQDPGNVGAIVRVAEAGGASGAIVAGASADPFGWKALRGSMGSALRLPLVIQKNADAWSQARQHGCRIVAAVPRQGRSMFDVDLTGPIALAIGGEGSGLPESLIADADERVTVPMRPPVESLNAAVTAALILYEAHRQRLAPPAGGPR